MGKNDFIRPTFFLGVPLPSQTMQNFKRAFFVPLYYEILPYIYTLPKIESSATALVLEAIAFLVDLAGRLAAVALDHCVVVAQPIELILTKLESVELVAFLAIVVILVIVTIIIIIIVVVVVDDWFVHRLVASFRL